MNEAGEWSFKPREGELFNSPFSLPFNDQMTAARSETGSVDRQNKLTSEPDFIWLGDLYADADTVKPPTNDTLVSGKDLVSNRGAQSDRSLPAREFKLSSVNPDKRDLPDATVYIPPGFDESKPVNVVIYNHGRYNTAGGDFKAKGLKEQMDGAPPNSILIVPAWQQEEGSDNNNVNPRFKRKVVDMVAQAVNQTGKSLDDIGSMQIVSHSAGYVPASIELAAFKNTPLYDRITSVANLDAHYGRQPQVDEWIKHNIDNGRFESGQVSYLNVFQRGGSPEKVSMGQVADVERWSDDDDLVGHGYKDAHQTADPQADRYPIAFVEVPESHGKIPNKYFATALGRVPRTAI